MVPYDCLKIEAETSTRPTFSFNTGRGGTHLKLMYLYESTARYLHSVHRPPLVLEGKVPTRTVI